MGLPGDLFDRLAGDDLSIQSVSFGRHGVSVGLAYLAVPGVDKFGVFQTPA